MTFLSRKEPDVEPEDDGGLSPIPAIDTERWKTFLANDSDTALIRASLDGRDVTVIALVAGGGSFAPVAILLDDETNDRLVPPAGTLVTDRNGGQPVAYA